MDAERPSGRRSANRSWAAVGNGRAETGPRLRRQRLSTASGIRSGAGCPSARKHSSDPPSLAGNNLFPRRHNDRRRDPPRAPQRQGDPPGANRVRDLQDADGVTRPGLQPRRDHRVGLGQRSRSGRPQRRRPSQAHPRSAPAPEGLGTDQVRSRPRLSYRVTRPECLDDRGIRLQAPRSNQVQAVGDSGEDRSQTHVDSRRLARQ